MAREVIVRTWCDVHLTQDDEHVEGEELPPLALAPRTKPKVVALCEVHRKEFYDPLVQLLADLGQPVPDAAAAAAATSVKRVNTGRGGPHMCPVDDCPYLGGPTISALQTHVRSHHDTTLNDLVTAAAAAHSWGSSSPGCPECGRSGFKGLAGLGAHRFRAHGVGGTSTDSKAAKEARQQVQDTLPLQEQHTCPECGGTFQAAKAMGSHRLRKHGVKGTSESARRRAAAQAD